MKTVLVVKLATVHGLNKSVHRVVVVVVVCSYFVSIDTEIYFFKMQ